MQLGVDFDGTIYRYRACRKYGACDASVIAEETTYEAAQMALLSAIRADKKRGRSEPYRFWIMKETRHYERVFDSEPNE